MTKNKKYLMIIVSAFAVTLAGCGSAEETVSQEEYDKIVSEIEQLQQEQAQEEEVSDNVSSEENNADSSEEYVYVTESVTGRNGLDHGVIVPLLNGQYAEIEADRASLTPNKSKLIYQNENSSLCVRNAGTEEDIEITDDILFFNCITNTGFFYVDMEGNRHRYRFLDGTKGEDYVIGKATEICIASNSLDVAYAQDGIVYRLVESSSEPEKIGDYEFYVEMKGISDNGELIFWSEFTYDDDEILHAYAGGNTKELLKAHNEQAGSAHSVAFNNNFGLAYNSIFNSLYLVQTDGNISEIELDTPLSFRKIFSEKGVFQLDENLEISNLYFVTREENNQSLYCLDLKNLKATKMLENVDQYVIADSHLYYCGTDKVLKHGELSGDIFSEEGSIAENVSCLSDFCLNGYLYFLEDNGDDTSTLCVFKNGEQVIKIARNNEFSINTNYRYNTCKIGEVSLDGKTIYFEEAFADSYYLYGYYSTLWKYEYGAEEPTIINDNVYFLSLSSGYMPNYIDDKSYIYLVYEGGSEFDEYAKWVFQSGVESSEMKSVKLKEY